MKYNSGFTLIEVLVVIALITLSMALLMPRIEDFFDIENNKTTKILNRILLEAYNISISENRPVLIWGVKGGRLIHCAGKIFDLEKTVFRVRVNESYQEGLKYYFFVYPDGLMDKVEIIFENDMELSSNPLLVRFTNKIS